MLQSQVTKDRTMTLQTVSGSTISICCDTRELFVHIYISEHQTNIVFCVILRSLLYKWLGEMHPWITSSEPTLIACGL
jgi:hypothetical protein